MVKSDLILEKLIEIKEDVGGINQHLENLNGKVAINILKINSLEKDNIKNKIMWAKFTGIAIVISTIISIILRVIFL